MITVASFDSEIEAELARGSLESEGIPAQVRFSGRTPYPRYAIGYAASGIGLPMSMYEVLVRETDAGEARAILAAAGSDRRDASRRKRLLRIYALVMLVPFLATIIWGAWQQLRLLF